MLRASPPLKYSPSQSRTTSLSANMYTTSSGNARRRCMPFFEILRRHGTSQEALRIVYKAVVLAKLTYAAPAWWGFASADDRKRLEAFMRRGVRLDTRYEPTINELFLLRDLTTRCSTGSYMMKLVSSTIYSLPPVISITFHKIRQKTRIRARMCFLGVFKIKINM